MKKFTLLSLLLSPFVAHAHTHVYVEAAPAPVVVVNPNPVVVVNPTAAIIATEAPPEPIVEQMTVSPGPNYVYVPGQWEWHDRWVWKSHAWVARPHPGAAWEPAHWHWSHHAHGYVMEGGHWR